MAQHDKRMKPFFQHIFASSADLLENVFGPNEFGDQCYDLENGRFYLVQAGGPGAASMRSQDGGDIIRRELSLNWFRKVSSASDVGAIAAIGGILASDTTPIFRGDAAETQEIAWATAVVDSIAIHISLPGDLDDTRNVSVELDVYSGVADAATFTVESGWNGGALVSDSASDAATKSATRHTITATIAASDVPASPKNLTLVLTPGAHATDVIALVGARWLGYRK